MLEILKYVTEIIVEISESKIFALDLINKIHCKSFDWKSNGKHVEVGLIAQELEKLNAEWVFKVPQPAGNEFAELYQVNDKTIFPYLIKAAQELSQMNTSQQTKIDNLQSEVEILKQQVAALKEKLDD